MHSAWVLWNPYTLQAFVTVLSSMCPGCYFWASVFNFSPRFTTFKGNPHTNQNIAS